MTEKVQATKNYSCYQVWKKILQIEIAPTLNCEQTPLTFIGQMLMLKDKATSLCSLTHSITLCERYVILVWNRPVIHEIEKCMNQLWGSYAETVTQNLLSITLPKIFE